MLAKIENKFLYYLLIVLTIIMPLREFISQYFSSIKIIPDILIILSLLFFIIIRKGKIKFKIYDIFFIIFILIGLLSNIINKVSLVSYVVQLRSISIMYGLFYLIRQIPLTKKELTNILKLSMIISSLIILLGVIEAISNKHLLFPYNWTLNITTIYNYDRVYSLLYNPNTFSFYILLITYFMTYMHEKENTKFNYIYLFLTILGIFLASSRSALIMLIFLDFIYIIYLFTQKKYRQISIIVLIFILSFAFNSGCNKLQSYFETKYNWSRIIEQQPIENVENIEPPLNEPLEENNYYFDYENSDSSIVVERFKELFEGQTLKDSMLNGRLKIIMLGLDIFKTKPLLGTGFGTFGSAGSLIRGSYLEAKYGLSKDFYADNEYIKVFVETGLIGTLAFLTFIISLFIRTFKNKWQLLTLFILLFAGLFFNIFEVQILTFYLYFLLAIINKRLESN